MERYRTTEALHQPLQGGIPDVGEFRFRHRIGLCAASCAGPFIRSRVRSSCARVRPPRFWRTAFIDSSGESNRSYCGSHPYHIYDYYGHMQDVMRKIQLKDAKANLSAWWIKHTRQAIRHHSARQAEAVVLGFADWVRLSRVPSFGPSSDVSAA